MDRLALFDWPIQRFRNYAGQLACRDARRRSMRWRWLGRSARFHTRNLLRKAALGPVESPLVSIPKWYER